MSEAGKRLISAAKDAQTEAMNARIEALEAENVRMRAALSEIRDHRQACHRFDDDMGYPRREFDQEDWKIVELLSRAALSDTTEQEGR